MGFLKKLFGKKESNHSSKKNQSQIVGYNNFTDYNLPDIKIGLSGNIAIDTVTTVGSLGAELEKKGLSFDIKGFFYSKLLEEGLLKIPVIFSSENKNYSLFFIYDEDQAKAFNSIKNLVLETDYPNPIYISKIDVNKITESSIGFVSLNFSDLTLDKNEQPKGEYAMWWSENGDNVFHKSKSKKYIDRIYEITKGYESYVLGYILSQLNIEGFESFRRVQLPLEEMNIFVEGPEYKTIIITVSQEKGIRFMFPQGKVNYQYRERFLNEVQSSINSFKMILMIKDVPKDEKSDLNGYDWYNFMTKVVEEKEKNGELGEKYEIGVVSF